MNSSGAMKTAKSEAYEASYKNMGTMSDFLNSLQPTTTSRNNCSTLQANITERLAKLAC